jgi:hypothetical protein
MAYNTQAAKLLARADLHRAAELFADACMVSRSHARMASDALSIHGAHGPDVSGCVREHFPIHIKGYLRDLAHGASMLTAAAHAARPARVRVATMRALARAVAARDGSGFYGPQA